MEEEKVPIVLVASGTATTASATYRQIETECHRQFPGHPIHWAYSSRAIRKRVHQQRGEKLATPEAILDQLARTGCAQAVVQSLHLIGGIEFHHLAWKAAQSAMDIHFGLPLLTYPEDFDAVLDWMAQIRPSAHEDALVLVGHGTAHPAWMAYAVLSQRMADRFGDQLLLGQIKGEPEASVLAARLVAAGYGRVHLRPFMLVAGAHFMTDISGDQPTSWRSRLEGEGLNVIPTGEGMGSHPAIIAVFCNHIRRAMESPPLKME